MRSPCGGVARLDRATPLRGRYLLIQVPLENVPEAPEVRTARLEVAELLARHDRVHVVVDGKRERVLCQKLLRLEQERLPFRGIELLVGRHELLVQRRVAEAGH